MASINRQLAFVLLACSLVCAQDQKLLIDRSVLPVLGRTTTVDVTVEPQFSGTGGLRFEWRHRHSRPSRYIRVHIVPVSLGASDWWISVTSENGTEIDRISRSELSRNPTGVWTQKIPGDFVSVALFSTDEAGGIKLRIDKYNSEASEPSGKAIVHGYDDRVDLGTTYPGTHRYVKWSSPIAALFFQDADTDEETNCTGFLLSQSLLLTNRHCIFLDKQIRTAEARFAFQTNSQSKSTRVKGIIATDEALDFTLLRLESPQDSWGRVQIGAAPIVAKQKLILIQHPDGQPKQIAAECDIEQIDAKGVSDSITDFYHMCDSSGGSSGSPVMDESTGAVVGLHHFGRWDPTKNDYHNLGVKMGLILEKIKQQNQAVYQEITQANMR